MLLCDFFLFSQGLQSNLQGKRILHLPEINQFAWTIQEVTGKFAETYE
jgi:hypothetical protein